MKACEENHGRFSRVGVRLSGAIVYEVRIASQPRSACSHALVADFWVSDAARQDFCLRYYWFYRNPV
jgi:hypothetical protein